MKCPKCKTDGAYQPLLRQLECPNGSCSFYVAPKVHYAVHSVDMKKPDKNGDTWHAAFTENPRAIGLKPMKPSDIIMGEHSPEIHPWTSYEDAQIRMLWSRQSAYILGQSLARSEEAVRSRAIKLGLRLTTGYNPCNEITLSDPTKDKYPLDSFEVMEVTTERNHYSKHIQMRVTLVGNFYSEKDMADARVALYEILRKRTRREVEKIEGEMSHGYGILDNKRIGVGKF